MRWERETSYQRAVKALKKLSRRKKLYFTTPQWRASTVTPNGVILHDFVAEICRFRFGYGNRLHLIRQPQEDPE
jgi:hypothetical protein